MSVPAPTVYAVPPLPALGDVLLGLLTSAPALAVAIGAYSLHRRDCKDTIKALREENARLLEMLRDELLRGKRDD